MKTIILLCLASAFSQVSAQTTFSINFRPGSTWDHSAVGGPAPPASNGLGYMEIPGPAPRKGYSSGSTQVTPGVSLTVSRYFIGTAGAGPNNLTFNASNTPGFAFQNLGTGDKNTGRDGSNRAILNNYQRVDFFFSKQISLNSLQIGDIDTASSTGATTQSWRDAVGIELWLGNTAGAQGTGIAPTISTPGSPSRLLTATTSAGLRYAYANTLGNTISSNPMSPTNSSSAFYSYNTSPVSGFSMYLWNHATATTTGGQHAVVLQFSGSSIAVAVPEPSSALLLMTGAFSLILRRKK